MDKILIVEDSMELSDALCRNLQDEGFFVSAASCLVQARKILDSGIDLCLLDLNLPDGDGFTFCRYLSENTAIPIILLTVRDDAQDMVRGLSIGAVCLAARAADCKSVTQKHRRFESCPIHFRLRVRGGYGATPLRWCAATHRRFKSFRKRS